MHIHIFHQLTGNNVPVETRWQRTQQTYNVGQHLMDNICFELVQRRVDHPLVTLRCICSCGASLEEDENSLNLHRQMNNSCQLQCSRHFVSCTAIRSFSVYIYTLRLHIMSQLAFLPCKENTLPLIQQSICPKKHVQWKRNIQLVHDTYSETGKYTEHAQSKNAKMITNGKCHSLSILPCSHTVPCPFLLVPKGLSVAFQSMPKSFVISQTHYPVEKSNQANIVDIQKGVNVADCRL